MKDWSEENSVLLAEWTYDNYKYEEIQVVTRVLHNPPQTENKSWRLTPDTIREWMTIELEKVADNREQRHNQKKLETPATPVGGVNYEAYKKRIESGCLDDKKESKDDNYEKFKTEYLMKKLKKPEN